MKNEEPFKTASCSQFGQDKIDSFFCMNQVELEKTFLISLILAEIRSNNGIAFAVVSSGIAATLLDGGRTAHSVFKLPLNIQINPDAVCNIKKKQSSMATVLNSVKLSSEMNALWHTNICLRR